VARTLATPPGKPCWTAAAQGAKRAPDNDHGQARHRQIRRETSRTANRKARIRACWRIGLLARRQQRAGVALAAAGRHAALCRGVFAVSTIGYVRAGWPLGDAAYMVLLTIFSVGYGEVRPIDSTFLRLWTTMTIVLGCTGMIVLTGALVQVFTLFQFRRLLGLERMHNEIERLTGHTIICGYGRIGVQLARALSEAKHPFLILERTPIRAEPARAAT
jgi:hypothetical protein